MLLGRLRGATSQQLGEAARQLEARLQRHQAALAASLSGAIDRGAGLLAEAHDRRDQRTAELRHATELLDSVAAAIQPPPTPSGTSQPATADQLQ